MNPAAGGLGSVGRIWFDLLVYAARMVSLSGAVLAVCFGFGGGRRGGIRWGLVGDRLAKAGVDSIPIVFLTVFLVGSILSLAAMRQLGDLGVESFVPGLVGLAFLRDLAPLIASIMISARIGAKTAAELAVMKVSDQITALETLAVSPVEFLVVPRIIALVVAVPCLALFSGVVGILGGALPALWHMDASISSFFAAALAAADVSDLLIGLGKSAVFGGVAGLAACCEGLNVQAGARAVGDAAARSVVFSIALIVAVDLLFDAAFFAF